MALVMVNERSEREKRQMDNPEGQKTDRQKARERERSTEEHASSPLTHSSLAAVSLRPITPASVSADLRGVMNDGVVL